MSDVTEFSGRAPLFPLPGAALFPHVVQPFHMFEPRYRQLAADVVGGERLIALAVLKPNHSALYDTKAAPIFPHACLGRVTMEEELPDGRWNLIVQGLCRVRIADEIDGPDPYRVGALDLLPDGDVDETALQPTRRAMLNHFTELHPKLADHPALQRSLADETPLGSLCDFLSHAVELEPHVGATLLGQTDVETRCRVLSEALQSAIQNRASGARPFPPAFSLN